MPRSRARAASRPEASGAARVAGPLAVLAVGLAAGVVLFGDGRAPAGGPLQLGGPAAESARPGSGPQAPDFTVKLLEGGTFSLSQQAGRPVLILFTASWCAPCIPEVNNMASLHEEFDGRGLRQVVISVDPQDTADDLAVLRDRTRGQKLMWALDERQRALRAYGITATDTKVLVDAQGRIVFRSIGPTDLAVLRREVAKLLP